MQVPLYFRKAKVTRVIDGDTVEMLVDNGFYTTIGGGYARFRLYGIDTMELNSSDPVKRGIAQKAKLRVEQLCLNREVLIKTRRDPGDKYGRFLTEIWTISTEDGMTVTPGEPSVNQTLVNENLAVAYFGGTK